MTIVSVQSFSLGGAGGGPRILRALYEDAPRPVLSVATTLDAPAAVAGGHELHLPLRPRVPKVDGTRLGPWAHALDLPLSPLATRRLEAVIRDAGAAAVHCVAHGPEFWPAYRAARRRGLPFLLTVHDDMRYLERGTPFLRQTLDRLGEVWRAADERFAVSDAIGREYAARWGERPYTIVTDGLRDEDIAPAPRPGRHGLRVYFAGLFHNGYAGNLRSLVGGLERAGGGSATLTLRCGTVPAVPPTGVPVDVLSFAPEAQLQADLETADVLWLPLMFEPESRDMIRFSLSTKLVTYLGSGLPILYQGPAEGAAFELLARHDAAMLATDPTPEAVTAALLEGRRRASEMVHNALRLARESFRLADQREKFWTAVERHIRA